MSLKKIKRTNFVRVRSKNETANPLRRAIPSNGKNVIVRLGSKTPTEEITKRPVDLELNKAEACILSNNKIKMKEAFDAAEVKTAEWRKLNDLGAWNDEEGIIENWDFYPAIVKHIHSCRGEGIYYIETPEDLYDFIEDVRENNETLNNYIIEKYYKYSREYRLHVSPRGCFYACRKMLKNDAEDRWHRHDNNSVWILPENELFKKPNNWNEVVDECMKAAKSVGLDICAIDVKMQGGDRENPKFIILETNSGPSLGEIGVRAYKEEIYKLVDDLDRE